jgi:hypothetical protein
VECPDIVIGRFRQFCGSGSEGIRIQLSSIMPDRLCVIF